MDGALGIFMGKFGTVGESLLSLGTDGGPVGILIGRLGVCDSLVSVIEDGPVGIFGILIGSLSIDFCATNSSYMIETIMV